MTGEKHYIVAYENSMKSHSKNPLLPPTVVWLRSTSTLGVRVQGEIKLQLYKITLLVEQLVRHTHISESHLMSFSNTRIPLSHTHLLSHPPLRNLNIILPTRRCPFHCIAPHCTYTPVHTPHVQHSLSLKNGFTVELAASCN